MKDRVGMQTSLCGGDNIELIETVLVRLENSVSVPCDLERRSAHLDGVWVVVLMDAENHLLDELLAVAPDPPILAPHEHGPAVREIAILGANILEGVADSKYDLVLSLSSALSLRGGVWLLRLTLGLTLGLTVRLTLTLLHCAPT